MGQQQGKMKKQKRIERDGERERQERKKPRGRVQKIEKSRMKRAQSKSRNSDCHTQKSESKLVAGTRKTEREAGINLHKDVAYCDNILHTRKMIESYFVHMIE